MMKEYTEPSAASRERAIKFAIVPETQLTESVEQSAKSRGNIASKSISGMTAELTESSATSKDNAITWD